MIWQLAHRYDRRAVLVADRHYSRQKPGTPQFMAAGSAFVLYASVDGREAAWGTSWPFAEHTKHEWAGAWMCSLFRNEGAGLSSDLILSAVAATRYHYGEPPALGMVTFVNPAKLPGTNPGYCFLAAGFRRVGITKRRKLLALQMLPHEMPPPAPALGMQSALSLI